MIDIKKNYSGLSSLLLLKLKQENREIPPPIKPPKIKRADIEEELDILPPPPPLAEWGEEKSKELESKELEKPVFKEKKGKGLDEKEKQLIAKEIEAEKHLKEIIRNAEEKRRLEEQRAKQLKILMRQREKEELKYEKYIKRMGELEKKKKDKEHIKEIKSILIRLDSGIKAIDGHERILREDIEKNLKLTKDRLAQVEIDLKTEKDYINESKKIRERIKFFENLVAQGKTNLDDQIKDLKHRYSNYAHKAESIRRAILAKIGYIRKVSEEVEKEEKRQKEFEEEKKKILEVEKLLARKRALRGVKNLLIGVGLYKTEEDKRREELERIKREEELEKLRLEKQKEQERRLEEEERKRETELKMREALANIREFEENKAKKEKAGGGMQKEIEEKEKKEFEKKLKQIERLRKKEKEKLTKGNLFAQLFKPKKITPEGEIKKAIEQLKTPAEKVIKPGFVASIRAELNDAEYINQRIADANEAILNLDLERAKKIYIDILKVYNNLSNENKRRVYDAVNSIYNERKNAEKISLKFA